MIRKPTVSVLVFLLLCLPSSLFARDTSSAFGYVHLSTRHKYSPKTEKKITSSSFTRASVAHLGTLDLWKRKAPTRRRAVSSNALRRKLSSRSALIMDARTGKILYAIAPDRPRQPASTIKVLTGLIAIDSLKNSEMVPVSRRAARMPRSKLYLRSGKSYPANDLINGVLLASANDASVAVAERIAGSEKRFASMMTRKARALGAKNTVCKSASGLTRRGQKTTVRDLAVIFKQAMKHPEFAERMRKVKVKTKWGKTLWSHNKALWKTPGAVGGKTGYTRAARQTYVGKFSRGSKELIVAIMGSESMWNDIGRLVEYGFQQAKSNYASSETGGSPVVALANIQSFKQGPSLQVLTDIKKISANL